MSENNNTDPIIEEPQDNFPAPKKPSEITSQTHSFELEKDYNPPSWSGKPTKNYFLEIIKEGVTIGNKDINEKSFYLVGKLQDLCDIALEHPSISRKHAIFQHKNDGSLYLYDLGSTHGTKVNKTNLVAKVFHKLHVGDVIKFGQSSRLFIVGIDGSTTPSDPIGYQLNPSDFKMTENEEQLSTKKAVLKEKYLELMKRAGHSTKAWIPTKVVSRPEEVSWGMVDEDEIRAYEDEEDIKLDPDLLRELPDLTPKDYDKINEYEKKLRQYQGIEKELEHVNKKEREEFGLSENDKIKRQALETKVNEIYSKLQMMEDNLKHALFEETKTVKDRIAKRREADTFEDDEFYDRTIKKVKAEDDNAKEKAQEKIAEGETFETLKSKLEMLIAKRQEMNERVLELSLNPEADPKGGEAKLTEEDVDELDKFMQENDNKIKTESKSVLIHQLRDVNNEIDEIQKLLKFVRPAYKVDMNSIEKKTEEKKVQQQQPPKPLPKQQSQAQPKPNPQQTMLERLKALNKKVAEDEEGFPMPHSEFGTPKEQNVAAPKKKVYGVAAKPLPRNLRESDYENQGYADVDWVPPEEHESL